MDYDRDIGSPKPTRQTNGSLHVFSNEHDSSHMSEDDVNREERIRSTTVTSENETLDNLDYKKAAVDDGSSTSSPPIVS